MYHGLIVLFVAFFGKGEGLVHSGLGLGWFRLQRAMAPIGLGVWG